MLEDKGLVEEMELGWFADRTDGKLGVVCVFGDFRPFRLAFGCVVDADPVVGDRDLLGEIGLVVMGILPGSTAFDP